MECLKKSVIILATFRARRLIVSHASCLVSRGTGLLKNEELADLKL